MEIQGTIKLIGDTKTFGNNGFQKRDIVISTEEQYPQDILIEFVQDKCVLLDNFGIGQNVKIGINLRGREWVSPQGDTKYFNSIQGWRIDTNDEQSAPQSAVNNYEDDKPEKEENDLPF